MRKDIAREGLESTVPTFEVLETLVREQAQAFIDQIPARRPEMIALSRPALLVLDLQEYFLNPESHAFVPSAPAILPGVIDLIRAFQKANLPVVFTQHINTPDDAGMMAEWWRDLITPAHPLAGLSNQLPLEGASLLQKTQYDAFYQTDLADRFEAQEVTDVVITGVMTHLCCETTARSAFVHGYRVWFTVDGTACYNAEFHLSSLRNLAHGFATPVLTSEVLSVL